VHFVEQFRWYTDIDIVGTIDHFPFTPLLSWATIKLASSIVFILMMLGQL
jgi:hypothetical protein